MFGDTQNPTSVLTSTNENLSTLLENDIIIYSNPDDTSVFATR